MQVDFQFYYVCFRESGHFVNIKGSDILYLEAIDKYVKVVTAARTYLVKATLSHVEEGLFSAFFCRVHRSYIIGLIHITRIDHCEATLNQSTRIAIPVSQTYREALLRKLNILNS